MARPTHTETGTFRQDPRAEREVDPPGAGSQPRLVGGAHQLNSAGGNTRMNAPVRCCELVIGTTVQGRSGNLVVRSLSLSVLTHYPHSRFSFCNTRLFIFLHNAVTIFHTPSPRPKSRTWGPPSRATPSRRVQPSGRLTQPKR